MELKFGENGTFSYLSAMLVANITFLEPEGGA
jgi:hypothetical protein